MYETLRAEVEKRSHPKAKFWPLMSDDELQKLADDIKANKQRLPIYETIKGEIVDGRNRFLACMIAGVDPVVETITERMYGPIESFIASMNEHRRHLGKAERNAIFKQMRKAGKTVREVAAAMKVSTSTVSENSKPESITVRNRTVKHDPKNERNGTVSGTGKGTEHSDAEKRQSGSKMVGRGHRLPKEKPIKITFVSLGDDGPAWQCNDNLVSLNTDFFEFTERREDTETIKRHVAHIVAGAASHVENKGKFPGMDWTGIDQDEPRRAHCFAYIMEQLRNREPTVIA